MLRGPGLLRHEGRPGDGVPRPGGAGDRDGVTLLVTGDEEIGSPTSRALIEEEAPAPRGRAVLEASADGGALKTERKGVSLYDVRVLGRAAHAGLEPERGRQRHPRARPPGAARRRAGRRRRRHHRHARPSRAPAPPPTPCPPTGRSRSTCGSGRSPSRSGSTPRMRSLRAGAARARRSRSPAAPTGRRWRPRRRPRCSTGPALLAARLGLPALDRRRRRRRAPTATSPPASARRPSTASARSAAARTPTTSTSSSTSCPAAPPCSRALVADLLADPTTPLETTGAARP